MNIYTRKQRWKLFLLLSALLIGAASLLYTNQLVKKLAEEERKKVELWAQGTRELTNFSEDSGDLSFIFEVIKNNNTVPVMLVNDEGEIIDHRNLDSLRSQNPEFLEKQLREMKVENPAIEITFLDGQKNYIYYKNSLLLTQLKYYPFFQLGVIALFLLVSYLAFSASRKAEQNQVWVGMAKETAHQLGTPLSSLMAWVEYLKMKNLNDSYVSEIEKDISRLNTITERFSKIGSAPSLKPENIPLVLKNITDYIRQRSSSKVILEIVPETKENIVATINVPLFEWVIENLLKNAIDAMSGVGKILITISEQKDDVVIDLQDTGKGLPKNLFKTIFKPGFTTKSRGWGLGLSLSKRIIEEYHKGEIFVKASDVGKGTTFRILLKR